LSAAEIAAVRASGVTAVNLTVGAIGSGPNVFEEIFGYLGYWERELDAHPGVLMKVKRAADLGQAKASGRLGIIYGFQDATPLARIPGGWTSSPTSGDRVIRPPPQQDRRGAPATRRKRRRRGDLLHALPRDEGQPMAEDVIRHIEHALNVCGEDHVGIGTDGIISAIELTPEYVQNHREDIANRRRLGISASGEEDVYTFVPDLNTPRRFDTLAACS
jgi:microsomal dipeptidase-like Zn-dependent dipeptidase